MISWIIFAAKCRRLLKNSINKAFSFVFTKSCGQVLGILIFSKGRLILCQQYINNFAALGLNLRVNAATLNLSLPLYLLKLNIENELNDVALPFDGDLTSMRKFKSIQKR